MAIKYIESKELDYLSNSIIEHLNKLNKSNFSSYKFNNAAINHMLNALEPFSANKRKKSLYNENELSKVYGLDSKQFTINSPVVHGDKNDYYVLSNLNGKENLDESEIIFERIFDGGYIFYNFEYKNNVKKNMYHEKVEFKRNCDLISEFYARLLINYFSLPENIYFQIATMDVLFTMLLGDNFKPATTVVNSLLVDKICDSVYESITPIFEDIDDIIISDAFLNVYRNLNDPNKRLLKKYINERTKKKYTL